MAASKKKSAAKKRAPAKKSAGKAPAKTSAANTQALERRLQAMERQIGRLEDIQAVRTLHFKYGYYIDMCLYDEAVNDVMIASDREWA